MADKPKTNDKPDVDPSPEADEVQEAAPSGLVPDKDGNMVPVEDDDDKN